MNKFHVVWGFGSTGSGVGVVSSHDTRTEAAAEARRLEKAEKNPACGYWIEVDCEECGRTEACGCRCGKP